MNSSGQLVFTGQLQEGFGGVSLGDDQGVWSADGATGTLLAREGSGNVPGVAGGNFHALLGTAVDDTGSVVLRAELTQEGSIDSTNCQGLWRFVDGVGSLVARTNSGNVPGVTGGSFESLSTTLPLGGDGLLVHYAKLRYDPPITTSNDAGLWRQELTGGGSLLVREMTVPAPGVGGGTFLDFLPPRVNDNRQIVFLAALKRIGDIDLLNDAGIWRYSDSGGELIAREGVGNVPGVSSTTFSAFSEPTINAAGQVSFSATMNHSGGVDSSNDAGIWLSTGTTGSLLARTGSQGVPGVPGADFLEFDIPESTTPLLNDLGEVLVKARLATGSAGVTSGNDLGLWKLRGTGGQLVTRTGSGGVPGVPGASFLDFGDYATNQQGFTVTEATLAQGGDIDAGNDSGLWLLGHSGGRLIAREGDSLAGHTIESVSFVGYSGGNDGRSTGLNAVGQVAFQASFANNEGSGLFLYSYLAADFDDDGDVDGADLSLWELAMGESAGADADLDGDSDGKDFLIWQRQRGLTALSSAAASQSVPEPATAILLIWAIAALAHRRRAPG